MLAQVPGLAPGWWVGVQLDDSDVFAQGEIYDRSWGIVDGVRYFECERRSVASQPFSFHFHTLSTGAHTGDRMAGSDHFTIAGTVGSCDQGT